MIICEKKDGYRPRNCFLYYDESNIDLFLKYVDMPYIYAGFPLALFYGDEVTIDIPNPNLKKELNAIDILRVMETMEIGKKIRLEDFLKMVLPPDHGGDIITISNPLGLGGCLKVGPASSLMIIFPRVYAISYHRDEMICRSDDEVDQTDLLVMV